MERKLCMWLLIMTIWFVQDWLYCCCLPLLSLSHRACCLLTQRLLTIHRYCYNLIGRLLLSARVRVSESPHWSRLIAKTVCIWVLLCSSVRYSVTVNHQNTNTTALTHCFRPGLQNSAEANRNLLGAASYENAVLGRLRSGFIPFHLRFNDSSLLTCDYFSNRLTH